MQLDCRRVCVSVTVFVACFFIVVSIFALFVSISSPNETPDMPYLLALLFAIVLWMVYETSYSDSCFRVYVYTVATINDINKNAKHKKII